MSSTVSPCVARELSAFVAGTAAAAAAAAERAERVRVAHPQPVVLSPDASSSVAAFLARRLARGHSPSAQQVAVLERFHGALLREAGVDLGRLRAGDAAAARAAARAFAPLAAVAESVGVIEGDGRRSGWNRKRKRGDATGGSLGAVRGCNGDGVPSAGNIEKCASASGGIRIVRASPVPPLQSNSNLTLAQRLDLPLSAAIERGGKKR